MKRYNKQLVLLVTDKGTAKDEKELKYVWKKRLLEVAPYYRVEKVIVLKGFGKED